MSAPRSIVDRIRRRRQLAAFERAVRLADPTMKQELYAAATRRDLYTVL
jgi:hypothetical protein